MPRAIFATLLRCLGKKLPIRLTAMFNLYQNINKKDQEEKESQVIGHERWYQERTSRSSLKKKKRVPRRAHSAAEFSHTTLSAANKRAAFRNRSQSSENKSDGEGSNKTPQRVDSLAKVFFGYKRQSSQSKHEYSAVKTDGGNEKFRGENKIKNDSYLACKRNLDDNERYELRGQLGDIGYRVDKNWFTVHDKILGAERLLTLVPLPSTCPITPSPETRETLLELFRGLQHPYIHPVLDIDFWKEGAAIVSPLNPTGSLRDMIYAGFWQDDYDKKYITRGEGLPLRTVQCLGRQIIEALMFLRSKNFPAIYHLHSGNIIIQNGVARLAGLENPILGLLPKAPAAPETLGFGYLLFEMTAGYELPSPPSPAHLQLELERVPKVADALELIFQCTRTPTFEELIRCDLFRCVELRELRGASIVQTASPPQVLQLLDVIRNPSLPSPLLRRLPRRRLILFNRSNSKPIYYAIYYKKKKFSTNKIFCKNG
ncbi:slowpoke-binding protein isoform X2 [Anthonomus grandis grandis]|uniref:slowpoke-binding protein isoform X2 n=1 Tax=Anthonomus grandis grandis TaxID=2921223 RepID=UPI002165F619|nr:slowpoke-binding protein isoform X2 [Anthonomus grandis grandis]